MLILGRKRDEVIFIYSGDDVIEIMVTDISSRQVSIGIQAPDHIRIEREEISNRNEEQDDES